MKDLKKYKNRSFEVAEDLGWLVSAGGHKSRWVMARCLHCENLKKALYQAVRDGRTRCKCQYVSRSLPPGEASLNAFMHQYKANARAKGMAFELTRDEFRQLATSPCWYCNAPPDRPYRRTRGHHGDFKCNGVDRIDNALWYFPANCVPCCAVCNLIKRTYGVLFLYQHIERMYKHMSSKDLCATFRFTTTPPTASTTDSGPLSSSLTTF